MRTSFVRNTHFFTHSSTHALRPLDATDSCAMSTSPRASSWASGPSPSPGIKPYDDPLTSPYLANTPRRTMTRVEIPISPKQLDSSFAEALSPAQTSLQHAAFAAGWHLEQQYSSTRLALEALRLKRLEHEAAFEEMTFRSSYYRLLRAAELREAKEREQIREEKLLSSSVVRWRRASMARALHRWTDFVQERTVALGAIQAVMHNFRQTNARRALNSWKAAVGLWLDTRQWLQRALRAWRSEALYRGWRTWYALIQRASLLDRSLALLATWLENRYRHALEIWMHAVNRRNEFRRYAAGFIFLKERRAFSSWHALAKSRRHRQRLAARLAAKQRPPPRDFRSDLRDHFHGTHGSARHIERRPVIPSPAPITPQVVVKQRPTVKPPPSPNKQLIDHFLRHHGPPSRISRPAPASETPRTPVVDKKPTSPSPKKLLIDNFLKHHGPPSRVSRPTPVSPPPAPASPPSTPSVVRTANGAALLSQRRWHSEDHAALSSRFR